VKKAVAVIGASEPKREERDLARQIGRMLAEQNLVVVCGGLGGVMAAACEGAKSAGGLTVGILPMREKHRANPYVDIVIPTGLNEARNALVALSGEAVVAIGGGLGTLSEIALALRAGRTVVVLSSWELDRDRLESAPLIRARTAEEAIAHVLAQVARGG
jgi:uncharacterized protein (TIGR00725 family)